MSMKSYDSLGFRHQSSTGHVGIIFDIDEQSLIRVVNRLSENSGTWIMRNLGVNKGHQNIFDILTQNF